VLQDFDAYAKAQSDVVHRYADSAAWWKSSITNVARMGFFSSDRTIREYAKDIWGIQGIAPDPNEQQE
jgi:starch phosphorylase